MTDNKDGTLECGGIFPQPPPASDLASGALRLVVFDFDKTLTLETRMSCINDYCSGWRAQIDPWRVLSAAPGAGWDSYKGRFTAEGLQADELREEFNRGKHTPQAFMQQAMQNFVRESFNDSTRKAVAERRAEFLQEELHDPSKRLHQLSALLHSLRQGLDLQQPPGKMIVMTYNAWGAIFVLNALIHAGISQYFDAVHSSQNAVQKCEDGTWSLVRLREMPLPTEPAGPEEPSEPAPQESSGSQRPRRMEKRGSLIIEGPDISHLTVRGGGTLPDGAEGKALAVKGYYEEHGGLDAAMLVDDEADNIDEWRSAGGRYWIDLSQAPGNYKFPTDVIRQAAAYLGVDPGGSPLSKPSTASTLAE